MKTEFSQPRFTGARFDDHTLPVEVARDLAAYEALVVDLAKHLYKVEHPDRVRVPKGFTAGFHLDIERIDEGSTKPLLVLVMSGALLLTGGERSYFEQARDLIAECIATTEGPLPSMFPKELLSYFNQFGRSLKEGETLELPRPSTKDAVLTPDRRKGLVLAADEEYEREVELHGSIGEVDWEKDTFRLRLADGNTAILPLPNWFRADARTYGGRMRHLVTASGVATFDAWDRLKKVLSVDSLEVTQNVTLADMLDELAQLQPGWFEGGGLAPDKDQLATIGEMLVAGYPDELSLPIIVPTQSGNLLMEWEAIGDPSLDIRLRDLHASFHAFDATGGDIEEEFGLADRSSWQRLFAFLGVNIRKQAA